METNGTVNKSPRGKASERLFLAAMLLIVAIGVGAAMQGRSSGKPGEPAYIYAPMTGDQLADYLLDHCRESGKSSSVYAAVIERCREAGPKPAIEVMRALDLESGG